MKRFFPLFTCLALVLPVRAEVKPHSLFTDHVVLQQSMDVPIWGTAADGEQVTVELNDQKASATAAAGQWKVTLKPMQAGGPFTMKISGPGNSITVNDVAVGEVWVCSGQSNMASGLADTEGGKEEMQKVNDPMLRFFVVPIDRSETPQFDVKPTSWRPVVDAYSANLVGAVPYYLARGIRQARNVPVGVIQTVFGGSIAEAWTPKSYLESDPAFKVIFDRYPLLLKQYEQQLADYKAKEPQLKNDYEEALAKAKAAGAKEPAAPKPPMNPEENGKVQRDRPYGLYNAMLHPLQPYAFRGAAWYQGESSRADVDYRLLLTTMIRSWRETWHQGDFPFLIVQLPAYGTIYPEPRDSFWAILREAQLQVSKTVPNTGLAITIDCGDEKMTTNLHPPRKEPVGSRLALAARALVYGEKIESSGPLFDKADFTQMTMVTITFTHTGGGLVIKDNAELKGFTVAGEDKKWVNATAKIEGDKVVVTAPAGVRPVAVRYAWADYPVCNLFNKEGLPASPFRTDDWPMTPGGGKGK